MLNDILKFNQTQNSITDFEHCIRQGIPSAVFGVSDAFKNYLISIIPEKVLFVVKDGISARLASEAIEQLSNKKTVYIPPKDEILLLSRAFSKDNVYARTVALYNAYFGLCYTEMKYENIIKKPKLLNVLTLLKRLRMFGVERNFLWIG